MRHRVQGPKLNMDTDARKALNRYMATSFIETGTLTTTFGKASFVQPYIEKLVTKAKTNDLTATRFLTSRLYSRDAVEKVMKTIAPKFVGRSGGYTRLIKLGFRSGDSAPLGRLEWVESFEPKAKQATKKANKPDKVAKKALPAKVKVKKDAK